MCFGGLCTHTHTNTPYNLLGINQDRAFSVDVELGDDNMKARQDEDGDDDDDGDNNDKMNDDDDEKMTDDDEDNTIEGSGDEKHKSEPQDEDFGGESSSDVSDAPGGLVGLITNLSGVKYLPNFQQYFQLLKMEFS